MSERAEAGFSDSPDLIADPSEDRIIAEERSEWDAGDVSPGGPANSPDSRTETKDNLQQVEIDGGDISVDAALLGQLLNVMPAEVPALMRAHAITSFCERGVDIHQGEFRLNFFYQNRRARVSVDTTGRILRRSVVDFGQHPLPRALHRGGD